MMNKTHMLRQQVYAPKAQSQYITKLHEVTNYGIYQDTRTLETYKGTLPYQCRYRVNTRDKSKHKTSDSGQQGTTGSSDPKTDGDNNPLALRRN